MKKRTTPKVVQLLLVSFILTVIATVFVAISYLDGGNKYMNFFIVATCIGWPTTAFFFLMSLVSINPRDDD